MLYFSYRVTPTAHNQTSEIIMTTNAISITPINNQDHIFIVSGHASDEDNITQVISAPNEAVATSTFEQLLRLVYDVAEGDEQEVYIDHCNLLSDMAILPSHSTEIS